MIQVEKIDDTTFKVTVDKGKTTTHQVSVDPDYAKKLTGGKVDAQTLVERSFEFLLEREPNTSILGRFDLPVISQYFPEYEKEISKRLG